jgi:hypothetical protein
VTREIEILIDDLWRQHPRRPSTFSKCWNSACQNIARGGNECAVCVEKALAAIVGTDLAHEYARSIQTIRHLESRMTEAHD